MTLLLCNVLPYYKERRRGCLGLLIRLNPNTPTRIELKEALNDRYPKNHGRDKARWINVIKKNMKQSNLSVDMKHKVTLFRDLELICQDKLRS